MSLLWLWSHNCKTLSEASVWHALHFCPVCQKCRILMKLLSFSDCIWLLSSWGHHYRPTQQLHSVLHLAGLQSGIWCWTPHSASQVHHLYQTLSWRNRDHFWKAHHLSRVDKQLGHYSATSQMSETNDKGSLAMLLPFDSENIASKTSTN